MNDTFVDAEAGVAGEGDAHAAGLVSDKAGFALEGFEGACDEGIDEGEGEAGAEPIGEFAMDLDNALRGGGGKVDFRLSERACAGGGLHTEVMIVRK